MQAGKRVGATTAVEFPRGRATTRYSLRGNLRVKDPNYLYLSGDPSELSSESSEALRPSGRPRRASGAGTLGHSNEEQTPSRQTGSPCCRPCTETHPTVQPADPRCSFTTSYDARQKCADSKKVGRPLKYEESGEHPDLSEADKRRLRRRTANRESAKRVRDRRSQLSGRLGQKVSIRPWCSSPGVLLVHGLVTVGIQAL